MTDEERAAIGQSEDAHPKTEDQIKLQISKETWHEVLLEPNDAVLYSGTHSWHYRPTTLAGSADLVFFHFVKESFDGPLD